jgi:hypothetical protein
MTAKTDSATPSTPPLSAVVSDALFDLSIGQMDSPRLKLIKEHDIQTHHAPHCEEPWMAIPMHAARRKAKAYLEGDENDIASVTASAGILLEDAGLVFMGETKRDVEDAAIAFICRSNDQALAPPETTLKSMKKQTDPEAAETVQTTQPEAVAPPASCSALATVVLEASNRGITKVMASTQYSMGFLLVVKGAPNDIGGIIWRDDAMTHDQLKELADAVNAELSPNK